jgi:hypothetical protein
VRVQKFSEAIECWLQSNVKDVVRLIARLLWGTKVWELSWWRIMLITHSAQTHRAWDRAFEPTAKRPRGMDSDDKGGSSADEESSSENEDGLASPGISRW